MNSRVRIIKRNGRSYIVYRRLYNFRARRNLLTGQHNNYADLLYKGKKHRCRLIGNYWVVHI